MSTIIRTAECFPEDFDLGFSKFTGLQIETRPRHDMCQGGHHLPGVLGGWHCPCPCHTDQGDPT